MTRPLALLALVPALAAGADQVGAETCKACHPAAYEAWRDGPHARALATLTPAQRADRRCTVCHAPDLDRGVSGVTCETCHGGGRLYARSYVMRDRELARAVGLVDPGERSCRACHTESAPGLTRFDYARKLQLIEHGGDRAGRGARRAGHGA
ncbi:MAG TPA: multiheme c-type cytochrome [Anaeromyxobacteraceae bacterium]